MTTEAFSFEHKTEISPAAFLESQRISLPQSTKGRFYLVGFTLLGVAALFSTRTAALGGIILFVCAFAWALPMISAWGSRRSLKGYAHLYGSVVCGVSNEKLWYRGGQMYAESSWEGFAIWEEKDNVLRLSAHGLPALRFPIEALRRANVYDHVRTMMTQHGLEFDSAEAKRAAI
jgi:hypothetical protein